ncbi:MGMT family protein [Peribacillus psychrosaccharolyticus]|uniref:MGMT family protein n=1 Tax=Peribacillus psychrosaccharolyticus TaxID=1407 RepID=UPI003D2BCE04
MAVISIIQKIPESKVMTYGQIARCAGNPRAARQVVRILHSMSEKYNLPWHRVINAKGELGIKNPDLLAVQVFALEREGIVITGGNRVNLNRYQYNP